MSKRIGIPMIVLVGAALLVPGCSSDLETEPAKARTNPFKEGTGWYYHYVRANSFTGDSGRVEYPSTPYSSITSRIKDNFYTDRGVSNIMIYGPYEASPDFRGLPAIDYFDVQVGTGTVQDFEELVDAAHAKGITVTIYMAFLSVHDTNPLFRKAERDARNGIDSPETNFFRWAREKPDETPDIPEFEGGWAFSKIAQSWYATSWGYPALDYAKRVTRDYVRKVLRFWLDTGIDGIEYDFPLSFLGMSTQDMTFVDPNMVDLLITTPTAHSPKNKWLHAEGAGQFWDEKWNDDVGFTHILINGDEDFWSFPYAVMDGGASERRRTVDDLENHWKRFFDRRRARDSDLGVNAWSLYNEDMTPEQRALDAAVQAGMGALYSIDYEIIYSNLSSKAQSKYDDVFRILKRSPALAPGASRVRRPAGICGGGPADQVYAVERTSTDGSRTSLNIYNFASSRQCITVDLSDSPIEVSQTPVDLSTQKGGSPIDDVSYDVRLPAFGYVFLDVATRPQGPD